MNLSAEQEVTLRKRPHRTKLWLSIYQPKTLFSAQVTGTYSIGETEVTYFNPSGSWTDAYPNMTVLVGSKAGEDDVARIRMRAATGTYAKFAENSILWKNDQHLTFIDYINVDAIYPRIIRDPNNDESVIFYKDGDILYTDQNSIYGTFPNAGSHRAAFLETGTVDLFWSSSGTYNVLGQSLTYSWAFEGGTPTGSTSADPGYVSYGTPGHYKTRLITSAANGGEDTTYRYVSIYDRPEDGSNNPIIRWNLSDLSGSRGEGGYTASVRVWDELGSIEPNALVVIFADDWYDDNNVSLGGNEPNNAQIVFAGYILKDSIQFNYKDGWVDFEIGSVTEAMKQAEGFSVSCESKGAPSTWYQLLEMTVPKALYHYLRWHSTVLNTTDFQYTGDDRLVQYFDSDRSSLYDAVYSFVSEGIIGNVVADRQGTIWSEVSDTGYENPFISIPQVTEIQKHDWVGEPQYSERRVADVSFVEMGGIAYEGNNQNTFQAILSNAPSTTPLYRGKTDGSRQGLILNSQKQLNQLAGNYLENKNSAIESVGLSLAGNYRNYDIAPQELVFLLVSENDAPNGISLIGKYFKMQSMNWLYDSEKEEFYPDVTLVPVVTGTAAETVIIPDAPPTDGYSYPDFSLPPLPDFPSIPTTSQASQIVLAIDATVGILYTTDFTASKPEWQVWNTGIDASDITNNKLIEIFVTPNGSVWVVAYRNGTSNTYERIYHAPFIGGTFTKIIGRTWLDANYSTSHYITSVGYHPDDLETIAFTVGVNSGAVFFYLGNSSGFNLTATNSSGNQNVLSTSLTFGDNRWMKGYVDFSSEVKIWRYAEDGSFQDRKTLVIPGTSIVEVKHSQKGNNLCLTTQFTVTPVRVSQDGGDTKTVITAQDASGGRHSPAATPDGRYLMVESTTNAIRSSDFGFTWIPTASLVPSINYALAYCGGEGFKSRWAAGDALILYSADFGATWTRKDEYIVEFITPFPDIQALFAVIETSEI